MKNCKFNNDSVARRWSCIIDKVYFLTLRILNKHKKQMLRHSNIVFACYQEKNYHGRNLSEFNNFRKIAKALFCKIIDFYTYEQVCSREKSICHMPFIFSFLLVLKNFEVFSTIYFWCMLTNPDSI